MMLFLNKNQYRKYPFTKDASIGELPDSAIVALRITQCYGRLDNFYIRHVTVQDGLFTAQLWGITPMSISVFIGSFTAKITRDFQVIPIYSISPAYASGTMTTGSISAFKGNLDVHYTLTTGAIEPTCVNYYPRPAVNSITVYPHTNDRITNVGKRLTGNISLVVDGVRTDATYKTTTGADGSTQQGDTTDLEYGTATSDILAEALTASRVAARLKHSLCVGDCDTPIIYTINEVTPDVTGNITLLATSPLAITTDPVLGIIGITSSLNRETLCAGVMPNTAPYLANNSYYTAVASATNTEWRTWPQYTS